MLERLVVSAAQGRFTVAEAVEAKPSMSYLQPDEEAMGQSAPSMRPILDGSIFHFVCEVVPNEPATYDRKVMLQGRSSKARKRRGGPVGLAPAGWPQR